MEKTITAKQRAQQLLDKMPDDASPEEIWDMLDTWYHIDKARASEARSFSHEQAKAIIEYRQSLKPMTAEELNRRAEKSMQDIKEGRVTEAGDLLEEIKTWE